MLRKRRNAHPDSLVSPTFSLEACTRLSKSAISQSWREGATEVPSSPPPRRRRALAACTRVNVRMSQLNFLVSLFSPVQLACPTATLVAFHLTILSTKLRPAGDAEKAGRKRNGRRGGEGERRDGDGNEESNGLFQPGLRGPCGQESEGTRRSSAKEGEGVILPCVTRITRAALKSTQRTFYRGQS